jgi:putative methionine-R-sulfoxide reductase with GAF domain
LAHTAGELLQAPDPITIFGTLCEKVMQQLVCNVFFNYLKDSDSGKLHLNAYGGITKEEAKKIEWINFNKTICGFVARSGLYHVMENIPGSRDIRAEIVKSLGITAYACHPIILKGGEIFGTLSFGANNRCKFSSDDLSMMKAMADQIATAMNRLRNESTISQSERKYRWLFDNAHETISLHKLIFDESGNINIIDFDYCIFDINLHDLASLLIRRMKNGKWDLGNAFYIIDSYGSRRKIEKRDIPILAAFMEFPQDYWQIGIQYYWEKQPWEEEFFIKKLKKIYEDKDERQDFIEEFRSVK